MMRRRRIPRAVCLALALSALPAAAQDTTPPAPPTTPSPPANTLPGLGEATIQGIEIVEPKISCTLKTGLSQTWAVTYKVGESTRTEDVFQVKADRCTYVQDNDAETHRFLLDLSLDMSPTAEAAAACKVLSTALLVRLRSASADLQWPGITKVIREGALNSPETDAATAYTLSGINLRAVQRAAAEGANFRSYFYSSLTVFDEDASGWAKTGTFAHALAASVPLSDVDVFAAAAGSSSGAATPDFTPDKIIEMAVELEVLGFKVACLNDDGKPNTTQMEAK